ncbi:left-handed beta-roll domain-containing protein [Nostoc sp. CCY 9925]|uniref:left-handed beta-roll domain-containing protein n=1 Tax=Nostoc sp. CCY 9925 TaxID=3103865 RepID=UPI0039C645E3
MASSHNSIASSHNSIASGDNSIASGDNSIASIPFSPLYKSFQRQVFYIQFEKADFFNLASGQLHSV